MQQGPLADPADADTQTNAQAPADQQAPGAIPAPARAARADPGIKAAAEGRVVLPPVWRRRPTPAEIQEAYPSAAATAGVGGQAYLTCEIEPDSTLSHCTATDPKNGYGFGAAALSLAASFRIRPETIDGEPVVRGRVVAPIRFDPPDGTKPLRALWTAAPTAMEVRAALPQPGGKPVPQGGRGVMRCTVSGGLLTDCRPAGDRSDPLNRAAVKLAGKFAITGAFANGRPTESAIFDIPVIFDAPGATPPPPALENPVRFILGPTNAQKDAAFPSAARTQGVTRLTVTESCTAAPDGSLTACHADKEEPTGAGGAQAAARLVNAFQLSTWSSEGRPIAGAPVTIDITWNEPPHATAAQPETVAAKPLASKPVPRKH